MKEAECRVVEREKLAGPAWAALFCSRADSERERERKSLTKERIEPSRDEWTRLACLGSNFASEIKPARKRNWNRDENYGRPGTPCVYTYYLGSRNIGKTNIRLILLFFFFAMGFYCRSPNYTAMKNRASERELDRKISGRIIWSREKKKGSFLRLSYFILDEK